MPTEDDPSVIFEKIASLLRRRLEIISDHDWRDRDADGHLEALKGVSEEIAAAGDDFPGRMPAHLNHFLTRCSFDKALEFVENELAGDGGS